MTNKILTAVIVLTLSYTSAHSQTRGDSLGLPGDNFDLYGALDLFKQSTNTEAFEKALNDENNHINNLDLNNDGEVDYVKVVDRSMGDDKVLIIQDVISETESQDIAVVEMQKNGNENINLQVVGDEALYGKNYIIEPKEEQVKSAPAAQAAPARVRTNVYVNVWGWPGPRWMYGPSYAVWISPYRWRAYPVWWRPWRPVVWGIYYPRVRHFHHPYYHRVYVYNAPRAHKVYYGHRTTSKVVINNNRTTVVHRKTEINKVNKQVQPNRNNRKTAAVKQKQTVVKNKKETKTINK